MYLIQIAGLNILFTGDYSRETDRHLIPAAVPNNVRIDCLITESTFGISTRTPRQERENALLKSVTGILNRGGRVLMPTTAVGNTQELLLILEDYWQRHEEYRRFPIYYASGLARKVMVVYQTYVDDMNDSIRSKFQAANAAGEGGSPGPWDFQYVRALKGVDRFEDVGGSVVLASPGMLQNGPSRALLERWAPDAKNGVVITGYSVEGTMAKQLLNSDLDAIPAVTSNRSAGMTLGKRAGLNDGEKQMIPRRCTVEEFNFAVHVDGQENRQFIEEVNAPVVILVHGERNLMRGLKSRLLGLGKFKVYTPANCEEVRIPFRQEKIARVVGRLASQISPPVLMPSPPASSDDDEDMGRDASDEKKRAKPSSTGQVISGVLVQNDFKLSLMAPEDLHEYAGLTTTTIICRQRITLEAAGIDLIRWALEGTFGTIDISSSEEGNKAANDSATPEEADEELVRSTDTVFSVMGGAVNVICKPRGEVELQWQGNMTNDSIADAVMAVLLTVESSPAAVKQSSQQHSHDHGPDHFGDDEQDDNSDIDLDEGAKAGNHANGLTNGKIHKHPSHPLSNLRPEEKLSRLFMFLESQFGEESITPITVPKPPPVQPAGDDMEVDTARPDEIDLEKFQAQELARLHELGIPVPGLLIKLDKHEIRVWLEKLEVECANKTVGDRVRAVVERAVGIVAPLWE
jgi:cleavage and polyadenylation specificity factor subunit 3